MGDYDNDGFDDLFVTCWGRNVLYYNNGHGTFTDLIEKAGILKTMGTHCFVALTGDFDNDGWPDIYVACDSTPSILDHNNRDGTFTDIAIPAGCAFNEDGQEQAGMGPSATIERGASGEMRGAERAANHGGPPGVEFTSCLRARRVASKRQVKGIR